MSQIETNQEKEDRLVKRPKYAAEDLTKMAGKSSAKVIGGALGPDWHEGINIKGLPNCVFSFEVELS